MVTGYDWLEEFNYQFFETDSLAIIRCFPPFLSFVLDTVTLRSDLFRLPC